MRLAKLIAISGQASRRQAEKLILDGKVNVNGDIVRDILTFIKSGDSVIINSIDISPWLSQDFITEKTKLWLYHKPYGVITSRSDPQGRRTIFSLLPQDMQNVLTIGRLDYNTEGLILLTNNGRLARFFELPENNMERIYRCRVYGGRINRENIENAYCGLIIDGVRYRSTLIQQGEENNTTNDRVNRWFTVTISEGKNREIRKIFEHFGAKVNRLIRIKYGEFALNNMKPQQIIPIKPEMLRKYTKYLYLNN